MAKKGISYLDEEDNLVNEKLMVMCTKCGTVSVEEANFGTLFSNLSEIYQWAKQGKIVYKGWIKIFETDNALEDIIHIIRHAKTPMDCQQTIANKYGISKMSAEALVNTPISRLASLNLEVSKKMYASYSLAEKQLKPLLEE